MVSNRSTTASTTAARSATQSASAQAPKDALLAFARHSARIQIAALTAAGKAFAGWAHATERFTQVIGDEFLRRVDGETDSSELIVRVVSATNVHLRDLSALPSAATDHFNARLARASTDNT
jgi:uncharacterized membrane protein